MTTSPDPISPAPAPLPVSSARTVLRYFSLILWAVLFAVTAVLIGGILVPALGAAALFVLLVPSAIAGLMWDIAQKHRSYTVLAYVEQAMRLNLPLPALLKAAELSEVGGLAVALRRLRKKLEGGQTIHDSIAASLPTLPPRKLGLIGSAERCGRLPTVLQRLAREDVVRSGTRSGSALYLQWYPLLLLVVSAALIAMVSIFVLPKFEEIFKDFQIELPVPTVVMFDLWRFAMTPVGLYVMLIGLIIVLLLFISFTPTPISRDPLRGLSDRLKWYVPGVAALTRWRAMSDVCSVMADAMEVGRPLDWALTEASRSNTNGVLAEKLAVWADHVRAGMPAVDGARRANMPPLLVGLLRTAPSASLSEAMRFLARYYDSRFARLMIVMRAAMVPVISIVMGAIVLFITYSLFMPLIRLVNGMTAMPGECR